MSKKSLIISIFFFLLLLLAGNASSETEAIYAGWTVGDSWDDGSGTSYGTILRSADSGETWTRQGAVQIADVKLGGVFAVDPDTAWVVGNPDRGYATIYHTTDGGSTWDRKGSSNPASPDYVPNVELFKVHAVGDDVWAVGDGAILHTSDGGATWTNHFPAGHKYAGLQGVYTLDGKTVWATGGTRGIEPPIVDGWGIVHKTTNAGLTWTITDVDLVGHQTFNFILGISAADAKTAWAVGGEGKILLKTTDGGATWNPQWEPGDNLDLNEVYAVNSSTVWVAGDNSIWRTTDGGQSWDGSPGNDKAYMGICAASDQKAWASHVGRWRYIAYTTDGGDNWTKVEDLNGVALPSMWNISFATLPINLDDMIISLIEYVELLVDDGSLNQGQSNALIVKLEHALDRLVDDRPKAAINALNAFSNQVDAFVRGGVLPLEDGQDLSDQVNDIIELL